MLKSILVNKLVALVTSRRFLAALSGVAVAVLHEQLGLDEEAAKQLVAVVVTWIVGDSLRSTRVLGCKGVCEE